MCNKISYRSYAKAEKAMKHYQKVSRDKNKKTSYYQRSIYKCPECGEWHLSSYDPEKKRHTKRKRKSKGKVIHRSAYK